MTHPASDGEHTTDSGIPVAPIYSEADLEGFVPATALGEPGHPPFTRGPYETMYTERPWTMRQFAGFGRAEEANARYRFLLDQGQTALSVAFDLPSQLGYDSSHEMARAEVGRVGVAIDTAGDMVELFDGLPLGELSVNFTINATAPIILAFYLVAAEHQGVSHEDLAGTLQNDLLKEFLARKAFIFPPAPSMRLVADVVEWSSLNLPRFNPISITGYHAREAGSTAVQELGFTMASAIAYADELIGRGLDFDSFAPRFSFHFATTMNLFEEVAKLRAARRMWHDIATTRYGARDERSARLRFFSGNSGTTLTAAQPLNNVARSAIQCLGAVLGGAQSIHVMGYDEAYELPTEEAVTLSLRTQQIVAHESGVTRVVDPLAGSYYVEWLTNELERRASHVVADVARLGGAVAAVEQGEPQRWIADEAYRRAVELTEGTEVRVGVNRYADDSEQATTPRLFTLDPEVADRQISRTAGRLVARDDQSARAGLAKVEEALRDGRNVMPPLISAARAGVTLGELADVMRSEFGEFREPSPW